ncbi:MAG: response regulator [Deltaproteobacteria bacterium]|nr:response regulator [Deltaproteobacteria bacterium]
MNKSGPFILYVDDERGNRVVFQHAFAKQFAIVVAESAQEALAIMADNAARVAALVTDQRMPGMTGNELLAEVKRLYPEVPRIVMTAYSDVQPILLAMNHGLAARYILKPWKREEVERTLAWALECFEETRRESRLMLGLLDAVWRSPSTARAPESVDTSLAEKSVDPVALVRWVMRLFDAAAVQRAARVVYQGPEACAPVSVGAPALAEVLTYLVASGLDALETVTEGRRVLVVKLGVADDAHVRLEVLEPDGASDDAESLELDASEVGDERDDEREGERDGLGDPDGDVRPGALFGGRRRARMRARQRLESLGLSLSVESQPTTGMRSRSVLLPFVPSGPR